MIRGGVRKQFAKGGLTIYIPVMNDDQMANLLPLAWLVLALWRILVFAAVAHCGTKNRYSRINQRVKIR